MDIRIVNICNNNCLYCLEQDYRNKEKFISVNKIALELSYPNDNIVNFYGGNPLLHPSLYKIIEFSKNKKFKSISLLTNTYSLSEKKISLLIKLGLTGIGFFFNSFDIKIHNLIVNSGISLIELLKNVELIIMAGIYYKTIIHINNQNIHSVYKDVYILNKRYGVKEFEFINYFPFDRPYDEYNSVLGYNFIENKNNIYNLFKIIYKNDLKAKFLKFPRQFFGEYVMFYNFEEGILKQIGDEDIYRISVNKPYCLIENRCNLCFIKDNCKIYNKKYGSNIL